jgi:hypothetical protein
LYAVRIFDEMTADQLRTDLHRQFVEFLLVDVELGLTFATLAQAPQRAIEGRRKSYENATKAYNAVSRLTQRVALSESERREILSRLNRLKTVLSEVAAEMK